MKKTSIVFVLMILFLSGCGSKRKAAVPLCRVVTKIDVQWLQEEQPRSYSFTATEQIQPILIYLRTLRPKGLAEADPERLEGDAWKIVIHRSDGSQRTYRQCGEEYVSRDAQPWELMEPGGGVRLEALIHGLKDENF